MVHKILHSIPLGAFTTWHLKQYPPASDYLASLFGLCKETQEEPLKL